MTIRAVVFDIGGVLENTEDRNQGPEWEDRFGLARGTLSHGLEHLWQAGAIGEVSYDEVLTGIEQATGISPEQVRDFMGAVWVEYLGTLNTELFEYFRGLRPRYRTGILSNSFVGAREREAEAYGFPDVCDLIVYSHEVGMSKPDPRIYELTWTRLGVEPQEMIFVDNVERIVDAARDLGIHGIHHRENPQTIAEIEALLRL